MKRRGGRRLIRLGNFRVVGLHFVSAAINPPSWISFSLFLFLSLVSAFAFTLNAISLSVETTSSKVFLFVALRGSLFLPRFIQRDLPDNRISDSQNAIYYWALSIDFLSFRSLPRTFNPSSRIIIRFCSRTPPLWNLLPRSTLFLVDNSLFFFLPHFSANWQNLGNSNFLASILNLSDSLITRGIFKHANRFKNLSKNVRNFNPSLFFIDCNFAIIFHLISYRFRNIIVPIQAILQPNI